MSGSGEGTVKIRMKMVKINTIKIISMSSILPINIITDKEKNNKESNNNNSQNNNRARFSMRTIIRTLTITETAIKAIFKIVIDR